MKTSVTGSLLCCFLLGASAFAETSVLKLTPRQAAIRARSAATQRDFEVLARFYREQEAVFDTASKQQEQAYQYALTHWGSKSYPQSADRARQLRDYYRERCRQSREQSEIYTVKLDKLRVERTAGAEVKP